jgi:hypothetical protein
MRARMCELVIGHLDHSAWCQEATGLSLARFVANGLDPLLKWQNPIIAGHNSDATDLKSLREVHGADGDFSCCCHHIFAQLGVHEV